jgi:hypothetical protein
VTLRAVGPDEKAAKKTRKMSVADAAAKGTHLELLVAMRERIAQTVADPKCPPRDLAALTRRLQDIATEIASLELKAEQEAAESASVDDEAFDASAV